jgi:hypothetical protein
MSAEVPYARRHPSQRDRGKDSKPKACAGEDREHHDEDPEALRHGDCTAKRIKADNEPHDRDPPRELLLASVISPDLPTPLSQAHPSAARRAILTPARTT